MPKVSVIIPTYNRAAFLKEAIQSVLDQTFKDFELLVYDDGSTDNTLQVISDFQDTRIGFTRNETNKGVIQTRNNAVIDSNGEYIAFLDDDDEWLPDKLEKQISLLEMSPARIGAIYTGAYSLDTKSGKVVKVNVPKCRGNILKQLLLNNFITTSSIVLKNTCFEKVGLFDLEFKSASDFDMWIRIANVFEFDYVETPLVKYRIHQNSISGNYASVILGLQRLLTKHKKLFAANNKSYSNHLLKLGVAYCYNGNTKQGRKAFIQAIDLNPLDIRLYYNLAISVLGPDKYKTLKETKKNYFGFRSQN